MKILPEHKWLLLALMFLVGALNVVLLCPHRLAGWLLALLAILAVLAALAALVTAWRRAGL